MNMNRHCFYDIQFYDKNGKIMYNLNKIIKKTINLNIFYLQSVGIVVLNVPSGAIIT